MQKAKRKLALHTETIRRLQRQQLRDLAGGQTINGCPTLAPCDPDDTYVCHTLTCAFC